MFSTFAATGFESYLVFVFNSAYEVPRNTAHFSAHGQRATSGVFQLGRGTGGGWFRVFLAIHPVVTPLPNMRNAARALMAADYAKGAQVWLCPGKEKRGTERH